MIEPKFKVGNVLKPIMDDTGLIKCHVIEIQTLTCPGGAQVTYFCRIHTQAYKDSPASITSKFFQMNEIELEPWTGIPEKNKD